ncbi:flavodoxin-dependent (E)-4-hydroxy-3-methylbut-2-enyl-diphosphate synthase [Oscillospiraceae bacterium HV4-5-C5C]|nr:flavodoxin-dependent (E)-4-hydroxy-3-methylbut-2-enyl-diphosphate synthase [Oscillospiraceae bacterium HV4-5-C5C]
MNRSSENVTAARQDAWPAYLSPRRLSRLVRVGALQLGGGRRPLVQSMNNADPHDWQANLKQIEQLAQAGCDLTRMTIPDPEAARCLQKVVPLSPLPIVADIHFDYRLAIAAVEAGAAKIRINPGNIGGTDRVRQVARTCKEHGVPIRVGVNSGSLSRSALEKYGGVSVEALVSSALDTVAILEACDFHDLVISLKASDPALTIACYRELARRCDYPLHIGVTEAGTARSGILRSAAALGTLLAEGIGDTLRISLTDDPVKEVEAAWDLLSALDIARKRPVLISCPTCGRTQVDLISLAQEVENRLKTVHKPLKIAVMGCIVNGPGEAKEADLGIAGGKGEFLLFARGKILGKVAESQAVDRLFELIDNWSEAEQSPPHPAE